MSQFHGSLVQNDGLTMVHRGVVTRRGNNRIKKADNPSKTADRCVFKSAEASHGIDMACQKVGQE